MRIRHICLAAAALSCALAHAQSGGLVIGNGGTITITAGSGGSSNATQLQGQALSATAPTDGQALTYVIADNQWEPLTLNYATPGTCTSGQFFTATTFGMAPTCASVDYSVLTGSAPTWNQNTTGTSAGLTGTPDITVGAITASGTVNVANNYNLTSTSTATSGANYGSYTLATYASYWNGSAAVSVDSTQYLWVGSGTNPSVIEDHYYPTGLGNVSVIYAQNAANVATNSVNWNTPKFLIRGATWNGSASQLDDWSFTGIQGAGSNPTSTLTFAHTGTSGKAVVSVPQLKATGGTPGIQLTAAAFATYPSCSSGNEGLEEAVTDSSTATWGATVTGGGSNHIKMYCDGTNWTVEAK